MTFAIPARWPWCVTAALALIATGARGQALTNAADSAASARRLVSSAIAALRSGDTVAAHRGLTRATDVWPTQPAYLFTRAQLAAAIRDTTDVVTALTRFAAFGSSRDIAGDRFLARLASSPRLAGVRATLAQNAAPLVRSRVRATFTDSMLWPEGVAYDARADRFFVGSVRHRTIYEQRAGASRTLWTGTRADIGAILGVAMDPDGAHLWATTAGIPQMSGYTPPDSAIAALLRVRIADGAIVARFDLPPTSDGHTLGDVVVSAGGDVFMSDSREPVLHRLRMGANTLEQYRDPLFRSLQGVAPTPDGRYVYLADYSHGLLRLDLDSRTVIRRAVVHVARRGWPGLVRAITHRRAEWRGPTAHRALSPRCDGHAHHPAGHHRSQHNARR